MAEEDCIARGVISVNLSSMDVFMNAEGRPKEITSKIEKIIGGLAWKVRIHKLTPNSLKLYVHCNEQVKDHLWLCKVRFNVQLGTGAVEEKPFYSCSFCPYYGFNSHYWLFLVESKNNLLEIKPLEIRLTIKIDEVRKSFPPLDTSLVVNMGKRRSETLFVNKHILAGFSSYFRNLFFEDWRDKREQGGNHFELNEPEDFDLRAFKALIYASMTIGSMLLESRFLTYKLAFVIIKLAVKFDFPMLLDSCEKFMISAKKNSTQKMKLLELADRFSLDQLKEQCLNEMSVLDYMNGLGKSVEIHSRLGKATRERLQAKLDGKAKELRETAKELRWHNREEKLNHGPLLQEVGQHVVGPERHKLTC